MVHPAHPKNDRSRQVSWLAGKRLRPPSPINEWHNGRRLSANSCGSSYRFGQIGPARYSLLTPSLRHLVRNRTIDGNVTFSKSSFYARPPRVPGRRNNNSKSGTPKKAVRTPSFNSITVGIARMAVSASTSKMAPSKADGSKLREGIWPQ